MEEEASDGKGSSVPGTSIAEARIERVAVRRFAVERISMERVPMQGGPARAGSDRPGLGRFNGVRAAAWLGAGIVLILLSGCLPATVTPQRTVTLLSAREAYAAAVATIDTQPYPSNMGGWIITQADPGNGFVSAEMTYRTCGYVPFRFADFRCQTHVARVSVTLVERSDGTVLVAIGASDEPQARDLADALAARLRLRPVRTGP